MQFQPGTLRELSERALSSCLQAKQALDDNLAGLRTQNEALARDARRFEQREKLLVQVSTRYAGPHCLPLELGRTCHSCCWLGLL